MNHTEADKNTGMIADIIRPTATAGKWFYLTVTVLAALVLAGFAAWLYQLDHGLHATGMKNSVNWGVYMTNFVFFIGISHAGTLISAVLRVFNMEWRRPITRAAEAITVFALIVGGLQIVFDLGRPERLFNIITIGRLSSPLLWDVTCISVYFFSCIFYLLLPLIPDMALLKNMENIKGWRKKLYRRLSFNWQDSPEQKRRLKKVIGVMAILLIPIFVSVHTVVSWIFSMTVRPMWHSSIFGPYFVTGAIFSGVASVILAVALIRKALHLENYLKPIHFKKLSSLLMAMAALWFYFTFAEYLTTGYGALTEELAVFNSKLAGEFSIIFWSMVACMVLAFAVLLTRKTWNIGAATTASILVIIGMWLERFTIIVPTLTKPLEQGYKAGIYYPTLTEWLITIGSTAGFILLLIIFAKLFPIISIWEMKEAKEAVIKGTRRMESYLPESSLPAEQ
ncbi:MAG: polysulfide reductase NrfD [Candidatus Aminicenantes bacterium]|jgi:molybdopterin-containing oxidoreductase family membrane subunit